MAEYTGFPKDTIPFLKSLTKNNTREWFNAHKHRYEASFLNPALELIEALVHPLGAVAPCLKVEVKKSGGSLMRIYRDTRFSKDKTPYKTNIGIHFRHQAGKDVHAPGIYLHIAPNECFLAAGIWHPASGPIREIRQHIVDNPDTWKRALGRGFAKNFTLHDESLKNCPRGFDKEHPLLDYLKLKSFIGMSPLDRKIIESEEVLKVIPRLAKSARPLLEFLCEALGLPY